MTEYQTFQNPAAEYGVMPLWFWNDDLTEKELLRQLREFHRAGFGGVIPHPRIGLSKRIGYLTDEYFRLYRRVVEECERLGMKVILYDEGCYPSGSAKGAVVAANPGFASQAIMLLTRDVDGPVRCHWRPNTGRALLDKHVCTVLGRVDASGRVEPSSLRLLEPLPHGIVRVDVPRGRWKVMSVWNVSGGGHIRGVFAEEESGHQTAPSAADILNPDAVSLFLALTHDQYYRHLKRHFGKTIIAMFTDEPSVLGKGPHRAKDVKPFTRGFVGWLAKKWGRDPRTWLPALWVDYGNGTAKFRDDFQRAVVDRLNDVFYTAQARWCARHGIALTGHPQPSDDMALQRLFQIPGQDLVWRMLLPNTPTALEGDTSTAAKGAVSAARLNGRRRILTEVCGAYGWRHTLDEMKWLLDWLFVRGVNLINPHAVFYSIRDRRAWESEPDLGVHNVWWPFFHHIAKYARRLSWLLSEAEHVCDVAILGDATALPWRAAKELFQNQIDFLYLDDASLSKAKAARGRLKVGPGTFRAVVIDGRPKLSPASDRKLAAFKRSGGTVIPYRPGITKQLPRDIRIVKPVRDLRFIHLRRAGLDFYLCTNEGEQHVDSSVSFPVAGRIESWDALANHRQPLPATRTSHGMIVPLRLERRSSVVLAVDMRLPLNAVEQTRVSERGIPVKARWKVSTTDGKPACVPAPGDWAKAKGYALFTGTLVYTADVTLTEADELWLDLGRVGDIAEVRLDGRLQGVAMWAPHRVRLSARGGGRHRIEVRVTNSMANEYDGAQLPSGLIGPVRLMTRVRLPFSAR